MKFYVYHYRGEENLILGVYQESIDENAKIRPYHWLDIPDDNIGQSLLNLSEKYDLMLMGPTDSFCHYILYVDRKGYRFTQR